MELRGMKPMSPWPLLSPRRPRCPSSVCSSSSSSSSRAPSFSSEAQEVFDTGEDWTENREQECSYPEGIAWDCLPTLPTEVHSSLPNLKLFTLKDLKRATRNFDYNRLVGEGAFGRVYIGWIKEQTLTASKRLVVSFNNLITSSHTGSGLEVAVKNLKPEWIRGHNEWLMEVNILGRLNHPNIVKLIGFCSEADDHRLLVYEYVSRRSLDNHLFRSSLSAKDDVYSFGVVLLVLLSGQNHANLPEKSLVDWTNLCLSDKQKLSQFMDSRMEGQYPGNEAHAMLKLALHCLHNDANLRPCMPEVLATLEQLKGA